jgi:AraC-like DNA-binding protein
MAELTVAAGLANGLIMFAQGLGADRAALASQAGIALADLEDQDNRVPLERYVTLMRAAKAMTGDPALALHYGAANDLAQISIVGLIGEASETMLEAMHQLNRFGRLVVEFDGGPDRFVTAIDQDGVWGVDTRENPNAFPELTESTFARMICGPRRFGVTQLAKAVQVTHPDPGYGAEYERVFRAPVTFNAPRNAMLLDQQWIHHRLQAQPRYVFGIFSERAEALLQALQASKSMRGRVESLLMPILHTGDPRMETVADKLGLSKQTLARRLKAEGVTFEKVLDDLRHRLAVDYLQARKVSVNETAYLVGFSEPAAFSRAFKRWTGASPSTIRLGGRDNRARTS